METSILSTMIDALFSGVVSGVLVAIVTNLLMRRRTNAEIHNLEALTEKTQLEIQQLRAQMQDVETRIRIIDRFRLDDNHFIVLKEEERTLDEVMHARNK